MTVRGCRAAAGDLKIGH